MAGGFGAQSGPQPAAQQQGTSTPPTGFPSFGSPPLTGGTDASSQADGQDAQGQEQQQSPGPAAPD
jgi:hypothetical protein